MTLSVPSQIRLRCERLKDAERHLYRTGHAVDPIAVVAAVLYVLLIRLLDPADESGF